MYSLAYYYYTITLQCYS